MSTYQILHSRRSKVRLLKVAYILIAPRWKVLFSVDSDKNLDDPSHRWCIQRRPGVGWSGASSETVEQLATATRSYSLSADTTPLEVRGEAVETSRFPPVLAPISQIRRGQGIQFPLSGQLHEATGRLPAVVLFPPKENLQPTPTETGSTFSYDVTPLSVEAECYKNTFQRRPISITWYKLHFKSVSLILLHWKSTLDAHHSINPKFYCSRQNTR